MVPGASRAGFRVRDKLVTAVEGTMPVLGGTVTVDDGGAVVRAVVRVDATAVSTGNERRDRELGRPRFLSTGAHPVVEVRTTTTAAIASSTGQDDGQDDVSTGHVHAHAVVLARGASAPVELTATLQPPPAAVPHGVRVRVRGRLDRRPLGIAAPTVLVGRFLDLEADLVLEPDADGPPRSGAGAP
nr:YceI family protein [Quadrisphaera sp. RL12-1S]